MTQTCPKCGKYSLESVSHWGAPVKRCLRDACNFELKLDLEKIEHLKFVEGLLSITIEANIINNTDVSQLQLLRCEVRRMLVGFMEGNESWPEYKQLHQEAINKGVFGFNPEILTPCVG